MKYTFHIVDVFSSIPFGGKLETPSIEEFRESLKSTTEVHNVLRNCEGCYNLEPLSLQ